MSGRRILVRLPAALDGRGRSPQLGVTSTYSTCRCSHEDRVAEALGDKPYPNNPRVNDDAVAASIREFGFRQPIVVDADGVIICGHTRWKVAQKLGLEKVPVHVAKDLSPEQIKAHRIADNQTASLAECLGFEQDELALSRKIQEPAD